MAAMTTRAAVLEAHGAFCHCGGACGVEHVGRICEQGAFSEHVKLAVAPRFLSASEVENAAAPAEELRPWCLRCLNKAMKRARDGAAERRRIEGEKQLGFELDFDAHPSP